MATEISIPFTLDVSGRIATVSDPAATTRQHVLSLINTEPGERIVLMGYGVPLARTLFDDYDEDFIGSVSDDITEAFSLWEPGVVLREVIPSADSDEVNGLAGVSVHYGRADDPSEFDLQSRSANVATVRVGGRVTEVLR